MLSNLVERSREIGILKAVGWTERDVQKQLMGEVFLQSLAGGVFGIMMGYFFSYLLGFLSIPVATSWELNLLPAFAKDAEAATQNRPPSCQHLCRASRDFVGLIPYCRGPGELCHGETDSADEARRDIKATITAADAIGSPLSSNV